MSQLMKSRVGQQVRPYKEGGKFEKSAKDAESGKNGKEGSKREEAMDKKMMKKGGKC